jgi:periplasmic divalent cation tolerance protein
LHNDFWKGEFLVQDKFIVVLITVPSQEVGEKIAKVLVEQKLAACVNTISPIKSLFRWQGMVSDEEEFLLLVKSRADLFENELVPAVLDIHPYQVPEIIALPILMGAQEYLDWIAEETSL